MEETENQSFGAEGLRVNVVPGIQYIGTYICPSEERDALVCPQVEKWEEGVKDLAKVTK